MVSRKGGGGLFLLCFFLLHATTPVRFVVKSLMKTSQAITANMALKRDVSEGGNLTI